MEIRLTEKELAFINELDGLKGAFAAGVECAKQSFYQSVMRDRTPRKDPPTEPQNEPPNEK